MGEGSGRAQRFGVRDKLVLERGGARLRVLQGGRVVHARAHRGRRDREGGVLPERARHAGHHDVAAGAPPVHRGERRAAVGHVAARRPRGGLRARPRRLVERVERPARCHEAAAAQGAAAEHVSWCAGAHVVELRGYQGADRDGPLCGGPRVRPGLPGAQRHRRH